MVAGWWPSGPVTGGGRGAGRRHVPGWKAGMLPSPDRLDAAWRALATLSPMDGSPSRPRPPWSGSCVRAGVRPEGMDGVPAPWLVCHGLQARRRGAFCASKPGVGPPKRPCAGKKKTSPGRTGFWEWWWRNTEPNPRPFAEPDGNALALRAWIRRFGRIAHPALGFLVKKRVHGVPAPLRSTTPEWHSSWFHSPQATPPRGLALARSFFAKPGVPRRSSSLLPDQPPHD